MSQIGISVDLKELIQLKEISQQLELFKPSKVMTERAGGFTSGFRGRGIDFEEVRVYQAGDDIGAMDWRVTARTGTPHTKVFHEERERPVFIAVDLNPSMQFGTRVALKSVIAARAAAIVSWAAVKAGDRIGGIISSPMGYFKHRPLSRNHGVLPILKSLVISTSPSEMPAQPIHLSGALKRLQQVTRPGSLVIIFSDFYQLDDAAKQYLSLVARGCDVLACFIYDPIEKAPPPANYYGVSDGEQMITINTFSKAFCEEYRKHFQQRESELKRTLHHYGIPLVPLATTDDIVMTLNREIYRGQQ